MSRSHDGEGDEHVDVSKSIACISPTMTSVVAASEKMADGADSDH